MGGGLKVCIEKKTVVNCADQLLFEIPHPPRVDIPCTCLIENDSIIENNCKMLANSKLIITLVLMHKLFNLSYFTFLVCFWFPTFEFRANNSQRSISAFVKQVPPNVWFGY